MLEKVRPTTETIGSIRESKAMFNGQPETREYTPEERAQLIGGKRPQVFGMDWMDKPGNKIEGMIATGSVETDKEGE